MDHERYALALRTATELTAALDREIAECRLDLVTHYDGLVRVSDATSQTLASLKHLPRHVPPQRKVFLEQAVKRYQGVAQEQEVLVQRFKTDHAVLRNSLRALPEISERLIPALRQKRQPELLSALQLLLQDVLLLSVDPSAARVNQARCALNAFPGRQTGAVENCAIAKLAIADLPAEDALVLDGFVVHARSAIARHGAVNRLVSDLMHLPVAKRADEAAAAYRNIYADALREASQRWEIVGLLLIMAIVSGAACIILRLKSSAKLLHEATAQLKVALTKLTHERDQEAELADRILVNYGKAIQAYMRQVVSGNSPFDQLMACQPSTISDSAMRGAQLFVGKAKCNSCHSTSHFSDDGFHNLGVPEVDEGIVGRVHANDLGRFKDVPGLLTSLFNSAGSFSDDAVAGAARLAGLTNPASDSTKAAFRTPNLRGVASTAPYMHAGQFATLEAVVNFYDAAGGTPQASTTKNAGLTVLNLTSQEKTDLVEFLKSLSGDAVTPALLVDTSATP